MSMPTAPRAPKPAKGPGGTQPSRRSLIPAWAWWVLLVASLAWNGYALFFPKSPPSVELSYSDFLQGVRTGIVESVTISGQGVDGTFKQATAWPTNSDPSKAVKYKRFTTVLPPIDDPSVL